MRNQQAAEMKERSNKKKRKSLMGGKRRGARAWTGGGSKAGKAALANSYTVYVSDRKRSANRDLLYACREPSNSNNIINDGRSIGAGSKKVASAMRGTSRDSFRCSGKYRDADCELADWSRCPFYGAFVVLVTRLTLQYRTCAAGVYVLAACILPGNAREGRGENMRLHCHGRKLPFLCLMLFLIALAAKCICL